VVVCALSVAAPSNAQSPNLLQNPGFELGTFFGWGTFTNAFLETANPPQFQPNTGNYMASIFGGFWGTFNTSGIFQSFPASPAEVYEMDCFSRHFSGDALIGAGAPGSNWVIMKITFFDGSQTEIGGVEATILDGTYATDVWHYNPPIRAMAPPGTTSVQPLIIFLQPGLDPGAAHVDDLTFRRAFGVNMSQDPVTLDLTVGLEYGTATSQFGLFYSFDPANGTMPGMGSPTLGGLFIDPNEFNAQLATVFSLTPPFGGFLDANGAASSVLPGSIMSAVSGATVWTIGAQALPTGTIDFSPIREFTFQ